jgi:hypothetical protein
MLPFPISVGRAHPSVGAADLQSAPNPCTESAGSLSSDWRRYWLKDMFTRFRLHHSYYLDSGTPSAGSYEFVSSPVVASPLT